MTLATLSNEILDHVFGSQIYTPSSVIYVGFSTTTPNNDGSNFTEPVAESGYSRLAVDNNKTNWSVAEDSSVNNAVDFDFGKSSGNWGTLTHCGIFDAQQGGNNLCFDALASNVVVEQYDIVQFSSTNLVITFSSGIFDPLVGTLAGTSTFEGALETTFVNITGAVLGSCGFDGSLASFMDVTGTMLGSGSFDGSLTSTIVVVGDIAGSGGVVGNLTIPVEEATSPSGEYDMIVFGIPGGVI